MNRFLAALALASALSSSALAAAVSDGTRPDDRVTPGEIRTTDRAKIVGVNTSEVRNVSSALKLAVYRRYGMTGPSDTIPGTNHQGPFEVDHRLPLCAGGSNDITNLWIQAGDGPGNFHFKDALEDRICRKLKKGLVTVAQAQAAFLGDWQAAYAAEFGHAPRDEE